MSKKIVFSLMYISAIVNIILTPISTSFARIFGYTTIILFAVLPFIIAPRMKVQLSYIVLFLSLVFSMLLSAEHFKVSLIIDYLIPIISFFSFYYLLQMNFQLDVSFDFIYYPALILSFVFIAYSFFGFSFAYAAYNSYGSKVFTMGLGNPNAVSLYVLFEILIFLIRISYEKSLGKRIFLIILIVLMVVILIRLDSRTMVACAILSALFFFVKNPKRNITIRVVACMLPFLIVFILAINKDSLLMQKIIMGKALDTGRADIFLSFFDEIKAAPLQVVFGKFFKYPFKHLHNGPLTIVASLGIAGLIALISIWKETLKKISIAEKTKQQTLAYNFIFLFIVQASTEAITILGTIPYSIFVLIIVFIANEKIKIKERY